MQIAAHLRQKIVRPGSALCLTVLSAFLLVACDPDVADPSSTSEYGSLYNGTTPPVLVGLGGSLIAGMQDGAVYERASANGFLNLMAQQMGITEFEYPKVPEPGAGFPRVRLHGFDAMGNPVTTRSTELTPPTNLDVPRAYNVLGVPGALVSDMMFEGDFSAHPNPFLALVARNPAFGASLVAQAAGLQPDVLVIWTGNNDVLLWANTGGDGSGGLAEPTAPEAFDALYNQLLDKVAELMPNTKVIVLNIPDVEAAPYFTTLPWNILPLDAATAAQLNAVPAYQALGISFQAGQNGPVYVNKTATGGIKQAAEGDLLLLTLPTDSLAAGWGTAVPIPDRYVLDAGEAQIVQTHIDAYNQSISAAVAKHANVTLYDANETFNRVNMQGYPMVGSSPLTSSFISGGIFSMDGIHPCSRGYGVVANELLAMINTKFNADLPLVQLPLLPAVYLDDVP